MTEQEGVIKYHLDYQSGPAPEAAMVAELNAWRTLLYRLQLIGQDPNRYQGLGFGNLSCRLSGSDELHFVISGTQTGHHPTVGPEHYTTVIACDPATNAIVARGPVKPSSEALTHGAVYQQNPAIAYVMHVHSPEIWQRAEALGLPQTAAEVAYGTPAMAEEVTRLFAETDVRQQCVFTMAGHQDGVVAFGETAAAAGEALVGALARSLSC